MDRTGIATIVDVETRNAVVKSFREFVTEIFRMEIGVEPGTIIKWEGRDILCTGLVNKGDCFAVPGMAASFTTRNQGHNWFYGYCLAVSKTGIRFYTTPDSRTCPDSEIFVPVQIIGRYYLAPGYDFSGREPFSIPAD